MSHDDVFGMGTIDLASALQDELGQSAYPMGLDDTIMILKAEEFDYWEIRGGNRHDKAGAIAQKHYTDGISSAEGPNEHIALMRAALIAERKNKDDR